MTTPETTTKELADFLEEFLPRQIEAERAIHDGDVAPRMDLWSTRDPVTVLGAWGVNKSGWDEVSETFRWVASRFSNCAAYDVELIAADVRGDMAYTVSYERSSVSVDGGPVQDNVLRVTHVYRREDGEWKIVHRHGDAPPVDEMARRPESPAEARATSESEGPGSP
jgi:ketosteroid isomerase-like protein